MSTFFRSLYQLLFAIFVVGFILISSTYAGDPGMDWEYFSFSGHTRPELLAYPDGTAELIVKVSTVDVILILVPRGQTF